MGPRALGGHACLGGTAAALPHLVDLVDEREELLGGLEIHALLHRGSLLGGTPADVVQVRELLDNYDFYTYPFVAMVGIVSKVIIFNTSNMTSVRSVRVLVQNW